MLRHSYSFSRKDHTQRQNQLNSSEWEVDLFLCLGDIDIEAVNASARLVIDAAIEITSACEHIGKPRGELKSLLVKDPGSIKATVCGFQVYVTYPVVGVGNNAVNGE